MARIRSLKPDFFSDPLLAECSIPARYLYAGMFTEADDEGRLLASTKKLAGALFPHDDKIGPAQVARWLKELEDKGRVIRYEVERAEYLWIPRFLRHQRISHPAKSRFPEPPADLRQFSGARPEDFRTEAGDSPEALATSSGAALEPLRPDREQGVRKGTGNREEGGASHLAKARTPDLVFEAFCEVTGVDWHELSNARRGALNGMITAVREHGGSDPDEIRRRAENYHATFSTPLTPETLTRRWAELSAARPGRPQSKGHDGASKLLAEAQELERQGR